MSLQNTSYIDSSLDELISILLRHNNDDSNSNLNLRRICLKLLAKPYSRFVEEGVQGRLRHQVINSDENTSDSLKLSVKLDGLIQALTNSQIENPLSILILFEKLTKDNRSQLTPHMTSPPISTILSEFQHLSSSSSSTPTSSSSKKSISFPPHPSLPTSSPSSNSPHFSPQDQLGRLVNSHLEEVLIRDLVFVLQGVDGELIKRNEERERFVLHPSLSIPPGTKDLICTICELGWMFRLVRDFIERCGEGRCQQALSFALQEELVDYYRLISVLEGQMNSESEPLSLPSLYMWTQTPLRRMVSLASLCSSCDGVRGGGLVSIIHSRTRHGDEEEVALMKRLMTPVLRPITQLVIRWVYEGSFTDPSGDFFISSDSSIQYQDEQAWSAMFSLSNSLLPSTLSHHLAEDILLVGKSVNFIRNCCEEPHFTLIPSSSSSSSSSQPLQEMVHRAMERTNSHLLSLLREKFDLMEHLWALKQILLLGQGDFVKFLMDGVAGELDRSASLIHHHSLSSILDGALRSGNSRCMPEDVLDRIQVRLLLPSTGDVGWDIFLLDYSLTPPISTIVTSLSMTTYQAIFILLWKTKRAEWCLTSSWSQQMVSLHSRSSQALPTSVTALLHQCSVIRSRMVHFCSNLESYLMVEAVEESWGKLERRLEAASGLDDIILAHHLYLQDICERAMIPFGGDSDQSSESGEEGEEEEVVSVYWRLLGVLSLIIQFTQLQANLFSEVGLLRVVMKTVETRDEEREEEGVWGVEDEEDEEISNQIEVVELVMQEVSRCGYLFQEQVTSLLSLLSSQSDKHEQLQYLTFRLDFNKFYSAILEEQRVEEEEEDRVRVGGEVKVIVVGSSSKENKT